MRTKLLSKPNQLTVQLSKVYKTTEMNEEKLKSYLQEKYEPKKLFLRR